jgi:hypothetical protein
LFCNLAIAAGGISITRLLRGEINAAGFRVKHESSVKTIEFVLLFTNYCGGFSTLGLVLRRSGQACDAMQEKQDLGGAEVYKPRRLSGHLHLLTQQDKVFGPRFSGETQNVLRQ